MSLYLLIKFKFSVASTSVCPPDKKAIPGTSVGTFSFKHFRVSFATSSLDIFLSEVVPAKIILGFKIIPLKSILLIINSSKHFLITSEVLLKQVSAE